MPWEDTTKILDERSIGKIAKQISACKEIDLRAYPFEYIRGKVGETIEGYNKNVLGIDVSKNHLFRARKCLNGSSFENISDLWYNPDVSKINYGRANISGEQVLYLSSELNVAVLEIRARPGEIVNAIKCRSTNEKAYINILELAVFDPSILPKMNLNLLGHQIDLRQHLGRTNYRKNRLISDFIVEMFKKKVVPGNVHDYMITSSISSLLWYGEENDDALMYPSIASDYLGFNLALKPKKSDELLTIEEALELQVVDIRKGVPTLKLIRTGSANKVTGKIVWGA